ncbi:hypothetical protein F4805DRAFT_446633 [Annulohypoxylon moriforme]|nr:hypothetical protein F4805DRAFT_446633 [Annulohypoxylon moriforme]
MEANDDNVTPADKNQRVVVSWMINDSKGGFQEDTLQSSGGPPQFVSISKQDIQKNPDLQKVQDKVPLNTATIDRQGVINVPINKVQVPFVNVQAQIGTKPNRKTYSHVNVVADKKVGKDLIRSALNKSMDEVKSFWIVEKTPGVYQIQADRPK